MAYCKRAGCLLLALALMLAFAGCGRREDLDTALTLPGTAWRATPQDVIRALKISDDQILADNVELAEEAANWPNYAEPGYSLRVLSVNQAVFFGSVVLIAHFRFAQYHKDGDYQLYRVDIYYPEGTDMAAVLSRMEALYGAGRQATREVGPLGGAGNGNGETLTTMGEHHLYWQVNARDSLPEKVRERNIAYLMSDRVTTPLTCTQAEETLDKLALVTVSWTDDDNWTKVFPDAPYLTSNCVTLDGTGWVYLSEGVGSRLQGRPWVAARHIAMPEPPDSGRSLKICHCEPVRTLVWQSASPVSSVMGQRCQTGAATSQVCHCEPVRTLVWQSVTPVSGVMGQTCRTGAALSAKPSPMGKVPRRGRRGLFNLRQSRSTSNSLPNNGNVD